MERWVFARRSVSGAIAAMKKRMMTDTTALLQAATSTPPAPPRGDGSVLLTLALLTPATKGGKVHKNVRATIGQAKTTGPWTQIPLSWHAEPMSGLFPTFDGSIEIEEADDRTMTIAVIGTYRPPGSVVGGVADRLVLPHVAEDTIEALVRGLIAALRADIEVPRGDAGPQMTVGDLMSEDPIVLSEAMSLRSAASLLLSAGISGAPVVDDDWQLVGVLSESDLLDKVAPPRAGRDRRVEMSWRRHGAVTVGEACSRPAVSTSVDTSLRDATAQMAAQDIARLVVMRGATVAGIITRSDVMKALIRADEGIEGAVETVIAQTGLDQVTTHVAAGQVEVEGQVERRSDAETLTSRLAEIEGVLDVHAEDLTWQTDDVAAAPPMWL